MGSTDDARTATSEPADDSGAAKLCDLLETLGWQGIDVVLMQFHLPDQNLCPCETFIGYVTFVREETTKKNIKMEKRRILPHYKMTINHINNKAEESSLLEVVKRFHDYQLFFIICQERSKRLFE